MATTIEAKSLALLTSVASDPPLYPRNPTQIPHSNLVLYIVRVPGSRDVFLTPLKPREKVVSAEDVQSSLYFLHIDTPDDDLFEPPQENTIQESPSSVTRKPLPTPPTSPTDPFNDSVRQRKPAFDSNQRLGVPQRKPVSSNPSTRPSLDLPDIPPRHVYRTSSDQSGNTTSDERPGETRPRFSRRPVSSNLLGPRGAEFRSPRVGETDRFNPGFAGRASFEDPSTPEEDDPCVSLTLIRRDPTSGFQWNVAKIRDPIAQEISSEMMTGDGSFKTKKAGAPLFLEIHNPGYSKFAHSNQSRPVSQNSSFIDFSSQDPPMNGDGVFRRRLWMDGSRFADHSYGHRNMPSFNGEQQGQRSSLQLKRQSLQTSPRALVDRRSKGYSFQSPWGGKCEFATGTAGRSLKCKHAPDNPSSAVTEVSELRFNLPTSTTNRSSVALDHGSKRASYMSRSTLHRHTTSDGSSTSTNPGAMDMANFLDENGNIDLSLGKERAGGGFQGKQAKLGKLIIEDEGIKMLDLIVAANMALWWRAYERK